MKENIVFSIRLFQMIFILFSSIFSIVGFAIYLNDMEVTNRFPMISFIILDLLVIISLFIREDKC